jgi:hypothetical protein
MHTRGDAHTTSYSVRTHGVTHTRHLIQYAHTGRHTHDSSAHTTAVVRTHDSSRVHTRRHTFDHATEAPTQPCPEAGHYYIYIVCPAPGKVCVGVSALIVCQCHHHAVSCVSYAVES